MISDIVVESCELRAATGYSVTLCCHNGFMVMRSTVDVLLWLRILSLLLFAIFLPKQTLLG